MMTDWYYDSGYGKALPIPSDKSKSWAQSKGRYMGSGSEPSPDSLNPALKSVWMENAAAATVEDDHLLELGPELMDKAWTDWSGPYAASMTEEQQKSIDMMSQFMDSDAFKQGASGKPLFEFDGQTANDLFDENVYNPSAAMFKQEAVPGIQSSAAKMGIGGGPVLEAEAKGWADLQTQTMQYRFQNWQQLYNKSLDEQVRASEFANTMVPAIMTSAMNIFGVEWTANDLGFQRKLQDHWNKNQTAASMFGIASDYIMGQANVYLGIAKLTNDKDQAEKDREAAESASKWALAGQVVGAAARVGAAVATGGMSEVAIAATSGVGSLGSVGTIDTGGGLGGAPTEIIPQTSGATDFNFDILS